MLRSRGGRGETVGGDGCVAGSSGGDEEFVAVGGECVRVGY